MSLDVDGVLAALTPAEKAALTSGSGFWWTVPVERLGVPSIMVCDGPHGLRGVPPDAAADDWAELSLTATCFPTASALASSWNPGLLHRVGEALAAEARARRLSVILGPGINLKRSPLCGRNFEYFSEDPVLAGELACGIVDGIQSRGDVGTSVKHFAANNQETDRQRIDVRVSERALRELYLPAFERVVTRSRPWTVMCSYNAVNGVSASANRWLLDDVLRGEWGFDGLVVSDWGAVYDRVPALVAGTDLEMPPLLPDSPDAVVAAVGSGELDEAILDRRVRTVLELVSRGMAVLEADEGFDADAHHALARAAAAESVVLLANDGLLPLAAEANVAVIGEFARTPRFQGAGSSYVPPTRVDTALAELRAALGDVGFAPGYRLEGAPEPADGTDLVAEAVELAGAADVAVVFVGLPAADESEGFDRVHLDLPADQLALLAAVAARNPRVVTVLVNGAPVDLRPVTTHSAALVEAWLGGQAAGGAVADVLTGAVNPSGRLAETFPLRLQDCSSYLNFPGDEHVVHYGEGIYVGYRGYDKADQQVAFPFGHGLSYTDFAFSDLAVALSGSADDATLAALVEVTVTNTGDRDGAEVVQVYVADPDASVHRPVRELKGFIKVALAAGESRRVAVELDARAFAYWSEQFGRWVIEAGEFVVEVGRSSRDIVLSETVSVDATPVRSPLHRLSTLFEWDADPLGRELIAEAVAAGSSDPLGDREKLKAFGSMPLASLAAFPGVSLDLAALDHAIEEYARRSRRT
ncbi:glycoside hydrolase family 3 C-terminal domain-containing protein [Micropruina sonneratiae]|uniref:glycoside hydrolase family 3 C-terminal domain-containing protein n=1 Tax=Micropruina sonneratiae TaxID=2986940 RepID=UPI002226FE1F|nr:glycoside hydrolase family 3 C-terminal domain-containing protein [Micropruina sp. KQZ13P-5]MCW3156729.1 glycoside hydrolase family 3 C-terminal domain-containing protein [Micropruina sp. KQZ13P-5]